MIGTKEMEDYLREEHTISIPQQDDLAYSLQTALDAGFFDDFKANEVKITEKSSIVLKGKGKPQVIPELKLKGTYAISRALEIGYFDKLKKEKLKDIASELELTLEETEELVENCATKVLNFFKETFCRK